MLVYNEKMAGLDIRKWSWRIAIILAIAVVGYFILNMQTGPESIRPAVGQVTDPLLLPTIEKYADEVDADKGDPEPRMHLGMTYEAATLHSLAEATYQQYVDLFPKRVIGWYRLAVVQERQGNLEKAIQTLKEAATLAGSRMDAPHWQLGLWLIDDGRIEEAKKSLLIASSIKPNSMPLQIAKARIAIEEQEPGVAIDILNNSDLIRRVPDGYVYQLLGRAYRAAGNVDKAREAWGRAGKSKPRWGDPWTKNVMGHAVSLMAMRQEIIQLVNEGKIPDARKLIDEYFSYEPENRVVRRLDAMCDSKQGMVGKAIQKLMLLIKEDSNDAVSMLLLAKTRLGTPKLRTEQGLAVTKNILEVVIGIDPTNEQAKILLDGIGTIQSSKDE